MYAMYIGALIDGVKDHLDDYYDRPFDVFKKYYELPSLYRTPDEWRPMLGESTQMDWGSWLYVCSSDTVKQLFKVRKSGIAPVYLDTGNGQYLGTGATRSSSTLPKADWYGVMEVECY